MTDTHRSTHDALQLILMRHAKSDWGDHSLSDHERPLNKRGKLSAPAMAEWMKEEGLKPDLILSSSSTRTRQTVAALLKTWTWEPDVSFSDSLYLATPEQIASTIRSDHCGAGSLMIVAHNPGTASVVSFLAGQSIEMPTAAIAVFRWVANGRQPDWSRFSLQHPLPMTHLMRPKALGNVAGDA